MKMPHRWMSPLAAVLAAIFVLLSVVMPAAHAALIGTDEVLHGTPGVEHARVSALLERAEVRDALVAWGVDPAEVQARVAALTDDEARKLAANLDQLPAAGTDPLGFLLIIFIVLLVTDILGFTSVFPFVKKRTR